MNLEQLIQALDSLGVDVRAEGERLRVNAARGQLTDALKAAITTHKSELIQHLTHRGIAQRADLIAVSRDAPLPLSYFQERLWVLNRLDPASTAFNMAGVWKRAVPTDIPTLEAALQTVIGRHEVLRACVTDDSGAPALRLLPVQSVPITEHDFTHLTVHEEDEHLTAAMRVAAATPFDLAMQAPSRFAIYKLSGGRCATLVCLHHIAADAWSISVLGREVTAAYEGTPGPAPVLQYADYAAWQRAAQDPRALAADLQWWEQRLKGIPQVSAFPADLPHATAAAGATHYCSWSAALSEQVRTLARDHGATVYMAMLAACAAVLRAHTAQDDIVLGSPMGIRERPEFESLIGPFVNLLVLRLDLTDDPSFADLLRRARDAVLDAHSHRQVPFEKLLERLKPARSFNHSPLFQVAVVQHNAPDQDATPVLGGGAMHELTWFAREVNGQFEHSLEYRADLYASSTIARIASHLEAFLSRAAREPQRRLSELSVLTADERQQVVGQFNATRFDTGGMKFIERFEQQAALTPAAIAVGFDTAVIAYGELNRRTNQLAHHLRDLGAAPGSLIGICLNRSVELVVALLAVQKSGAAYLPLDPAFPADRLSFMLDDSGAQLLITAQDAAAGIETPDALRVVDLDADVAVLSERSVLNPESGASFDAAAYVIYTSGSTGRPKGVAVSLASLANFLGSMQREPGLTSTDILAAVTTISFDIAALELYLPLCVGARIELIARETAADGAALAAQLDQAQATVLQATPATWRLLLEADWRPRQGFRALCGGEPLPQDLAYELLPRVHELWNMYGPTETTIWSTIDRVTADSAISIGRPIANTQVYVLNRGAEPAPVGVAGEICIGGAGVALGYHRRPELTAERFIEDPFTSLPGARLYKTGDLGRWRADGRLEHLGRLDHQVKVRGFRIELGEIETVLSAHAAVRQSVVMAREAAPGDVRLIAYVAYQPGEDLTVSDVRRHLRRELPDYMIPSVVVAMDAIPLTANNKVDRAALPDPFKNALRPAGFEPPRSGTEQIMADIWKDVLQIERVGAEDNFFELGGHSLLSLRVSSAVEKRLGQRLDPRILFFQNLRQVAAAFSV